MQIVFGVLGIGLTIWSFTCGIGTRESNRAQIFQGPVGAIVSLAVIGVGLYSSVLGFGWGAIGYFILFLLVLAMLLYQFPKSMTR